MSLLIDRGLQLVLDGKILSEYPVNTGVFQGSILGPKLFLLTITAFLLILSVILLSLSMILLSIIRYDLCYQLE